MFRRGLSLSLIATILVSCAPLAEPMPELPTLAPTITPPAPAATVAARPSPTYTPLSLMGQAASETSRLMSGSPTDTLTPAIAQATLTRRPTEDPARTWTPIAYDDVRYTDPMRDWQCLAMVSLTQQVMLDEARKQAATSIQPTFPAYPYQMLAVFVADEVSQVDCWPSFARPYFADWNMARAMTRDVITQALPEYVSGGPIALRMTPEQIVAELEPIVAASQQNLNDLMQTFAAKTDYSLSEYQLAVDATRAFLTDAADPNLILTSDAQYNLPTRTPQPTLTRRPTADSTRRLTPTFVYIVSDQIRRDFNCISMTSVVEQVILDIAREQAAAQTPSEFAGYPYLFLSMYLLDSGDSCWPAFAMSEFPEWQKGRAGVSEVLARLVTVSDDGDTVCVYPVQLAAELEPIVAASQQNLEAVIQVFAANTDQPASYFRESVENTRAFLLWGSSPDYLLTPAP